jgi:heat shock protein HtpX
MGAYVRLFFLFAALSAIFVGFGWVIGTLWFGDWVGGAVTFLVLAGAMNAFAYFLSDRIVLWSYRAQVVSEAQAPRLYGIVRQVAQLANVPVPKVAIVPTDTPNAFATGRSPRHAVVAVTRGILDLLSEDELRGVLAHEISHVGNRDILVMSVAATIAGAISFMARMFWWNSLFGGSRDRGGGGAQLLLAVVGMVLAPIAAFAVQMAISRSREYKADHTGATTIGDPLALASALRKLEDANRRRPLRFGSPASQGLFIVNPFSDNGFVRLFRSHPPIAERVRRLEALAPGLAPR